MFICYITKNLILSPFWHLLSNFIQKEEFVGHPRRWHGSKCFTLGWVGPVWTRLDESMGHENRREILALTPKILIGQVSYITEQYVYWAPLLIVHTLQICWKIWRLSCVIQCPSGRQESRRGTTKTPPTFPAYLYSCAEMRFNLCTWFGEICSCSCLTVLPGPAWVLLNKICKE